MNNKNSDEYIQEIMIYQDETNNIFNECINFKNIQYEIPEYQRPYAWSEEEILTLIEDIQDFEEEIYYLGSLTVNKIQENVFEVIDGQQRLTTLFILLKSISLILNININDSLSFTYREKSNVILNNINKLENIKDLPNIDDIFDKTKLDELLKKDSICKGKHIIESKLKELKEKDLNKFVDQLKKVKIYRIIVPKDTDLNRYFETMNTRGEQLEQADLVKSKLISNITNSKNRQIFALIWEACSNMDKYVQMSFSKEMKKRFFKSDISSYNDFDFNDIELKEIETKRKLNDIISECKEIKSNEEKVDSYESNRFSSIIKFKYFLLHVLKIYYNEDKNIDEQERIIPELLDEKKLDETFEKVINNGYIRDGNKNSLILDNKEEFSLGFIKCLLKCRVLFDKYIIKRENKVDKSEENWSLKALKISDLRKEKPYYTNTEIKGFRKKTDYHKKIIYLESCLRVSYTSPKTMHWITEILKWLYEDKNIDSLNEMYIQLENYIKSQIKKNCYVGEEFINNKGVNTPHILFNYLDYILWEIEDRTSENKYKDFTFEFRNSVEHWYPQNPSSESFENWNENEGLNSFGNLCLLPRSTNSVFSNRSPESKKSDFKDKILSGSIKLRLMYYATNSNENWKNKDYKTHEKEMLDFLKERLFN